MAEKARLGATPEGVAGASSVAKSAGLRPLDTSLLQRGLADVSKKLDDVIISEAVLGATAQAKMDLDEHGVGGAPLRKLSPFNRRTSQAYNAELIRTTVEKVDQESISKANFLINHDKYRLDPEGARKAWDAYAKASVSGFSQNPMLGKRFAAAQAERLEAIGDKTISAIEVRRVQRNLEIVQADRGRLNQLHIERVYDKIKQGAARSKSAAETATFLNTTMKDEIVALGVMLRDQNVDELYNPLYVERVFMGSHDEIVKNGIEGSLVAGRARPSILRQVIKELDFGTEYFLNKSPQENLLRGLKGRGGTNRFDQTRVTQMRNGDQQIRQIVNGAPVGGNDVTVNSVDMRSWEVKINTTPDGNRVTDVDLGYWNNYAWEKYPENSDKRKRLTNSAKVSELAYHWGSEGRVDKLRELSKDMEKMSLYKGTGEGGLNRKALKKRISSTIDKIETALASKNKIDIQAHINDNGTVEGYLPILLAPLDSDLLAASKDSALFSQFMARNGRFVEGFPDKEKQNVLSKAFMIYNQVNTRVQQAKGSLAKQGIISRPSETGILMTAQKEEILRGASGMSAEQLMALSVPLIIAGEALGWDRVATMQELTSEVSEKIPDSFGEAVLIVAVTGASDPAVGKSIQAKLSQLGSVSTDNLDKMNSAKTQRLTEMSDNVISRDTFTSLESALSQEGAHSPALRDTARKLFRGYVSERERAGKNWTLLEFDREVLSPIYKAMGGTELLNSRRTFIPTEIPNQGGVKNALNFLVSEPRAMELLNLTGQDQQFMTPRVSYRDGSVEIQLKRFDSGSNSLAPLKPSRGINEAEASKAMEEAMDGWFEFDNPKFGVTVAQSDGGIILRIDASKRDNSFTIKKGSSSIVDDIIGSILPVVTSTEQGPPSLLDPKTGSGIQ